MPTSSSTDAATWVASLFLVTALYAADHGKAYNGLGKKDRRLVDRHAADRSYKLGMNQFADLGNEEYMEVYLSTRMETNDRVGSSRYAYRKRDELPEFTDWRDKGSVAPVKD